MNKIITLNITLSPLFFILENNLKKKLNLNQIMFVYKWLEIACISVKFIVISVFFYFLNYIKLIIPCLFDIYLREISLLY